MRKAEILIRDYIRKGAIEKFESQSKFAKRAGKSKTQLSQFLNGKRDITLMTFLNYLEALDTHLVLVDETVENSIDIRPDDIRQTIIHQFL